MKLRSTVVAWALVVGTIAVSAARAAGPPPADLSVTKSGPPTAIAGTNLTYVIAVSNAGPGAAIVGGSPNALAFGIFLNDTLPPQTRFVSLAQNTGPSFSCTTPAVGANGTVSCNITSLIAGDSATFTLVVAVVPGASGTISNTATVNTFNTNDPNPANDSATANTVITAGAAVPAMSPLTLAFLGAAFAGIAVVVLKRIA